MSLPPPLQRHFTRGFTTIELMVTVAILAVLAAIAAPSFNPLIERWKTRQATEELQSTLYFARSEAIKRGGGITISCNNCKDDASAWSAGWSVFEDGSSEPLQTTTLPSKLTVSFIDASSNAKLIEPIKVDRWGQFSADNGPGTPANFVFRLMPEGGSSTQLSAASLCISSGRIKRLNSGDGACST